jgi:hypothetical protein
MATDWQEILAGVARELCTNLFAAEVGSDLEAEITRETLKRRLLPVLEAGQYYRDCIQGAEPLEMKRADIAWDTAVEKVRTHERTVWDDWGSFSIWSKDAAQCRTRLFQHECRKFIEDAIREKIERQAARTPGTQAHNPVTSSCGPGPFYLPVTLVEAATFVRNALWEAAKHDMENGWLGNLGDRLDAALRQPEEQGKWSDDACGWWK